MNTDHERLREHWLVGCQATELGLRPLGVVVLGRPLVLYRSSGSVVVAEDRCPHRNAPLSHGSMHGGLLRCPYHGWSFNAEGRCVDAPGICDGEPPSLSLNRWTACESEGWIWVARPGAPPAKQSYRPAVALDASYQGFSMQTELDSNIADAIENLLDGTHTPFVHAGLVRSTSTQQSFSAVIRRHDNLVEAEYRGEAGQNGFISKWFEPDREVSIGRFVPPCTAELEYRSRRRLELLVVAHFTPASDGKLRAFVRCYLPNGRLPASLRYLVIKPFFQRVLRQDREILRLQQWNVGRFGKPAYTNWTADLLRPWIDAWLTNGEFPQQPDGPCTVQFRL